MEFQPQRLKLMTTYLEIKMKLKHHALRLSLLLLMIFMNLLMITFSKRHKQVLSMINTAK